MPVTHGVAGSSPVQTANKCHLKPQYILDSGFLPFERGVLGGGLTYTAGLIRILVTLKAVESCNGGFLQGASLSWYS